MQKKTIDYDLLEKPSLLKFCRYGDRSQCGRKCDEIKRKPAGVANREYYLKQRTRPRDKFGFA